MSPKFCQMQNSGLLKLSLSVILKTQTPKLNNHEKFETKNLNAHLYNTIF